MRDYRKEVILANVALGEMLAKNYKKNEPHYSKENIEIVDAKLQRLKDLTKGESLLDLGCGTGFIIDIAKKYFDTIRGVDVSSSMLQQVDVPEGDISLEICAADKMPFRDEAFDVVTAYALLHHLDSIEATLREAFRVLKPGGVFYSALDPNYYFLQDLDSLRDVGIYSEVVRREKDKWLCEVDNRTHADAEPLKYEGLGFREETLKQVLQDVGFHDHRIDYYWLPGEGPLAKGDIQTRMHRDIIVAFVKNLLPLSRNIFKYIEITAMKPKVQGGRNV